VDALKAQLPVDRRLINYYFGKGGKKGARAARAIADKARRGGTQYTRRELTRSGVKRKAERAESVRADATKRLATMPASHTRSGGACMGSDGLYLH